MKNIKKNIGFDGMRNLVNTRQTQDTKINSPLKPNFIQSAPQPNFIQKQEPPPPPPPTFVKAEVPNSRPSRNAEHINSPAPTVVSNSSGSPIDIITPYSKTPIKEQKSKSSCLLIVLVIVSFLFYNIILKNINWDKVYLEMEKNPNETPFSIILFDIFDGLKHSSKKPDYSNNNYSAPANTRSDSPSDNMAISQNNNSTPNLGSYNAEFSNPNFLTAEEAMFCTYLFIRQDVFKYLLSTEYTYYVNGIVNDYNRNCTNKTISVNNYEQYHFLVNNTKVLTISHILYEAIKLEPEVVSKLFPNAQASYPPSYETVITIQRELKKIGYSPGPADGVYGKRTKDALQSFYLDLGINYEGISPFMAKVLISANLQFL